MGSRDREPGPPGKPPSKQESGEPRTQSLYASLLEARRARRARMARLLSALVLVLVALAALWVLGTGRNTASPDASALQSSSTPDPTSPVAAISTPSGAAAPLSAATATDAASTPAVPATTPARPLLSVATPAPTEEKAAPATSLPEATSSPSNQLPLYGRRIGLDPGHGPRGDLGAVLTDPNTGKLILSEAEFNLDVALRCRDLLRARGATVMLTRETAGTFTAPWPADANGDGIVGASGDDLQERVDILDNFKAEAFLSIHANGGSPSAGVRQDVQVVYCGTSDCNFPARSKELGQLVRDELQAKLTAAGYTPQGVGLVTDLDADSSTPPEHLFVLGPVNPPRHERATSMPGVLAESLYVSSPTQAAELKKDSIRQAIAVAYADALQAFLTGKSGS